MAKNSALTGIKDGDGRNMPRYIPENTKLSEILLEKARLNEINRLAEERSAEELRKLREERLLNCRISKHIAIVAINSVAKNRKWI